jgi:hypothetical protein
MNPLIIIILILSILILISVPLYLIYLNNNTNNPTFTNIQNGCLYNRYGCCNDKLTPKLDQFGSNCRGF